MGDDKLVEEFPNVSQRNAVCESMWRDRAKTELEIEIENLQAEIDRDYARLLKQSK